MSITLKFDDKGYLPGLAHQLVTTLHENPQAEVLGVEDVPAGIQREVVFGLDGAESADDRLLITDLEVLVAAKEYCQQHEREFTSEILKHSRTAAYIIDRQSTPVFAGSRAEAGSHTAPGADA